MKLYDWLKTIVVCGTAWILTGCGQDESYVRFAPPTNSVGSRYSATNFFPTPFQTEWAFIAHEILTEVGEIALRAGGFQQSLSNAVTVKLTEITNRPGPRVRCDAAITLLNRTTSVPLQIDVIGSPAVYLNAARSIFEVARVKVREKDPVAPLNEAMLGRLLDAKVETIEEESQRISQSLTRDLTDAGAHQEAALLFGTLLLKTQVSFFHDPRHKTARLCAHLLVADTLSGQRRSVAGQLASVLLLGAQGRQRDALTELNAISAMGPRLDAWKRLLKIRLTGDYRGLDPLSTRTPLEQIEWFQAYGEHVGTSQALEKLPSGSARNLPDWMRIARSQGESVQIGHGIRDQLTDQEVLEEQSIYQAYWGKPLAREAWGDALNTPPERCLSPEGTVRVIGWGEWAQHLQANFCQSIRGDYFFLRHKYGVHEAATELAKEFKEQGTSLRLYPFVMLLMQEPGFPEGNHVGRALREVLTHPHLVPPPCWSLVDRRFTRDVSTRDLNRSSLARGTWFVRFPLPGTTWSPKVAGEFTPEWLDQDRRTVAISTHQLAPLKLYAIQLYLSALYTNRVPPEIVREIWGPLADYSVVAMAQIAWAAGEDREAYARSMTQAAELNPRYYFTLSNYFEKRRDHERSIQNMSEGFRLEPDRVMAVAYAGRLVSYYLDHNQRQEAARIANEAGAVYSHAGLEAKSMFHERIGELETAFEWLERIRERYGSHHDLLDFCVRHQDDKKGPAWKEKMQTLITKWRPKQVQRVTVNDFKGPPTNGVTFGESSPLFVRYALDPAYSIVALNGFATPSTVQFLGIRATEPRSDFRLIVWDGDSYREVLCSGSEWNLTRYPEDHHPGFRAP